MDMAHPRLLRQRWHASSHLYNTQQAKESGRFVECSDPIAQKRFAVEVAERIYTVRKKEIRKVDGKIAPSLPGVKSAICLLLRLRIWELLSLSFLGCLSLDAQHLR